MTWPNCLLPVPYSGQAILTSLYAHSLVLSCASGKSILRPFPLKFSIGLRLTNYILYSITFFFKLSHPWLGYVLEQVNRTISGSWVWESHRSLSVVKTKKLFCIKVFIHLLSNIPPVICHFCYFNCIFLLRKNGFLL